MDKEWMSASATALIAFAVSHAQTVANGPYYALPSWSQKLLPATRFIVLADWNNEAVLDRETGLVWQRNPSNNPATTWELAHSFCLTPQSQTGGRFGWRLPSAPELMSLVDNTDPQNRRLPPGHPFQVMDQFLHDALWTTTPENYILQSSRAFVLQLNPYAIGFLDAGSGKASYWCVRGPLPR